MKIEDKIRLLVNIYPVEEVVVRITEGADEYILRHTYRSKDDLDIMSGWRITDYTNQTTYSRRSADDVVKLVKKLGVTPQQLERRVDRKLAEAAVFAMQSYELVNEKLGENFVVEEADRMEKEKQETIDKFIETLSGALGEKKTKPKLKIVKEENNEEE